MVNMHSWQNTRLKEPGTQESRHPLGPMAVMSSDPNTSARDVLKRWCLFAQTRVHYAHTHSPHT